MRFVSFHARNKFIANKKVIPYRITLAENDKLNTLNTVEYTLSTF